MDMNETGLITIIIGTILLIGGGFGIYFFLPQFIQFFFGGFGIVLTLGGVGAIILGILMLKK